MFSNCGVSTEGSCFVNTPRSPQVSMDTAADMSPNWWFECWLWVEFIDWKGSSPWKWSVGEPTKEALSFVSMPRLP